MLNIRVIAEKLQAKGPSTGGWYNAKCPAHDDNRSSLGFTESKRGGIAVKCHAGCKRTDILSAIERATGVKVNAKENANQNTDGETPSGITLATLAAARKLPGVFLQVVFHCVDWDYHGIPCVTLPYFNETFKCVGLKYRLSLNEGRKFAWDDGKYKKAASKPYGVAQMRTFRRRYKWDMSTIVLCEGESDTWTLAFNGVPVLGIDGANGWKPEFADVSLIRDAKTLLVIQEPPKEGAKNDAGADFVKAIRASFESQPGKVVPVRFEHPLKDPSELWINNPANFNAAWRKKVTRARDYEIPFTHTGNAERLVERFGDRFRWLQDVDEFRAWNGEFWEPSRNGDGALLAYTKDVARGIADEKWALTSESQTHRLAMTRLSKGEAKVFAARDQFNKRPMLLNVANGTLDLEKLELRDFSREDFLTYKAPVIYDPFASCPKFDDFLDFTFGGNEELIQFVVKAMGLSLTGIISEQCFFLMHGMGGNGKSQLSAVQSGILGSRLAATAKMETFLETHGFNNREYELARLADTRYVFASEPKANGRFDEELLKRVTGDDEVAARPIYGHPFQYKAQFKLWIATNRPPRIIGTDEGIWRRIRYIPFTQTVPPERKIKDLGAKLVREEGPGILNLMLRGIGDWMREGLRPPALIERATQEYRVQQDAFGRFIAERCLVNPNAKVKCGVLYSAYKSWAEEQNEFVLSAIAVARELDTREFKKDRWQGAGEPGEYRFGIGILVQ